MDKLQLPPNVSVLGVSGRARAGKDSIAKAFANITDDDVVWIPISFAATLKSMVRMLFPQWANLPKDRWHEPDYYGHDFRDIHEHIGMTLREQYPTLWIDTVRENLRVQFANTDDAFMPDSRVLITVADLRLKNEYEFLTEELNAAIIAVRRPEVELGVAEKPSESELGYIWTRANGRIENNGSLDDLENGVRTLLSDLPIQALVKQ